MSARRPDPSETEVPWHNEVVLCGRLTSGPLAVALPSGDPLWRFRISVERLPVRGPGSRSTATRAAGSAATGARRTVDAVDCSTSRPQIASRLGALPESSVVEAKGTLTRRFWRAAGGAPASRYEVVVHTVRVVRRGPARPVTAAG